MSIEKQQFKNNLNGHVGVVVIGPKGDDRGIAVEPAGTVWLSEAEQVLTANAPRDPKDNPFVAQTWPVYNPETQSLEDRTVTPLTPVDEGRFVPASMRFIPGVEGEGARGLEHAQAAATGAEPVSVASVETGVIRREQEVREQGKAAQPKQPPPAPPSAAAAAAHAAEQARMLREAAQAAEEEAQDAAQGVPAPPPSDPEPEPEPTPPTPPTPPAPTPTAPTTPGTPLSPEPTGNTPVAPAPIPAEEPLPRTSDVPEEETAVQVDPAVGEETGAALPPTGDATAGTFSPGEEVGTPDAPQQDEAPQQPPPFTPGG